MTVRCSLSTGGRTRCWTFIGSGSVATITAVLCLPALVVRGLRSAGAASSRSRSPASLAGRWRLTTRRWMVTYGVVSSTTTRPMQDHACGIFGCAPCGQRREEPKTGRETAVEWGEHTLWGGLESVGPRTGGATNRPPQVRCGRVRTPGGGRAGGAVRVASGGPSRP